MGNLLRRTGRHSGAGTAGAGRVTGTGACPEGHDALSHAHAARLGPRTTSPPPDYGERMSTPPDIAVVGGGIAGASVAYELAATRSVVLLEAEAALGTHSTARSAATWIPGHGVAAVRALITASG